MNETNFPIKRAIRQSACSFQRLISFFRFSLFHYFNFFFILNAKSSLKRRIKTLISTHEESWVTATLAAKDEWKLDWHIRWNSPFKRTMWLFGDENYCELCYFSILAHNVSLSWKQFKEVLSICTIIFQQGFLQVRLFFVCRAKRVFSCVQIEYPTRWQRWVCKMNCDKKTKRKTKSPVEQSNLARDEKTRKKKWRKGERTKKERFVRIISIWPPTRPVIFLVDNYCLMFGKLGDACKKEYIFREEWDWQTIGNSKDHDSRKMEAFWLDLLPGSWWLNIYDSYAYSLLGASRLFSSCNHDRILSICEDILPKIRFSKLLLHEGICNFKWFASQEWHTGIYLWKNI